jgi:superfamily II RNA helicase
MSEFVRIVTDDELPPVPPAAPALVTGYEPDRFQKFAIEAIETGDNVLVTAKTGSGKTFVGEYQIAKSLQHGGRVFYTTPIKSLSNQKFHDLTKLFPQASVGIMTGDIKFRPDAQILIMTTEILRNLLFKRGTLTENVGATALVSLEGLDAVVFDEVHYINDPDRGHVWEETLMLMPPEVKLILLSATLSSPIGFARWLGESKKRRVWLISTLWRAVPLEHCVVGSDGKLLTIYDSKEMFHDQTYKAWLSGRSAELLAADKFKDKVKAAKAGGYEGGVEGKVRPRAFEHQMNELLTFLHTRGNLPAIFFVFSRVGCEKLAAKVAGDFLDSSDAAAVAHIWDFHLSRYRDTLEKSPQFYKLRELAMRGIAFHHSGLVPFLKEILEILFSKGYIKLLFATETFAVGINMPTKTVVFTALDKYSDGGIRQLRSAEYIQMAGRAGRRGKDDRGLVIYLPQREPAELVDVRQMLTGRAASFGSRMTFGYDFVLKVMNQTPCDREGAPEGKPLGQTPPPGGGGVSTAEPWKELVERSYWARLAKDEIAALQKESDAAQVRKDDLWRSLESAESEACEELERLEEEVRTLTNAKKKRAQRELAAWHEEHRESVWKPILARYKAHKESVVEADRAIGRFVDAVGASLCPQVRVRCRVLEEFGYVTGSGHLSASGRLASEVNEGHPFLMTEMFQRLRGKAAEWPLADLLTLLSLFLGELTDGQQAFARSRAGKRSGELADSEDVDKNKHPKDLNVSAKVRDELLRIGDDAQIGCKRERAVGLEPDPKFWGLSTEWVEPVAWWVSADRPILPQIAVECDIFEGNLQRALMKLMGLVEEWKAMATLAAETEWLSRLEGAQELVLRDIVVAESLYLRL